MKKKQKTDSKKMKRNTNKFIDLTPTLKEFIVSLIKETSEDSVSEAVLTVQQRRAMSRAMKRRKASLKLGRKKAQNRRASSEVLDKRSRRAALVKLRDRLSPGKKYSSMSPSEKQALDTRLSKISKNVVNRMAKNSLRDVRKKEIDRLKNKTRKESIDEKFERELSLFEERTSVDSTPSKLYHKLFCKDNTVNFDKRFKMYKVSSNSKPEDREQGTDSLVKIYSDGTPGECCNIKETMEKITDELSIVAENITTETAVIAKYNEDELKILASMLSDKYSVSVEEACKMIEKTDEKIH